MFKIVQTIERGKKELTIIPRAWEKNNVLYWPKSKADKLVSDENSLPEDNWFRLSCKLKRNYLSNRQIVEEELSRMLEEDDTEQEEPHIPTPSMSLPRKRPRVLLPKTVIDLNEIAESCVNDINSENMTPSAAKTDTTPIIIFQNETVPQIEVVPPQAQLEGTAMEFDIAATFTTIIENQTKIMNQLARFETMFDEAMAKFNAPPKSCACSEQKNDSALVTALNIQKLEDLETLEEKLKNTQIFQEYIKKMSFICGRNGKQKGIDVSYMLVDQFFERKFMLLCSWAGGARDNKEKIAFKFYKNTIRLFFEIVHLADNDFTLSDCETFFKNIIRNAVKRNESSNTRASKSKKRPSNLCYRKDTEGATKQHGENCTQMKNNEELAAIVISQEKENISVDFEAFELDENV